MAENSTASYTATAYYTVGDAEDVTNQCEWTTGVSYADFNRGPGELTTKSISKDETFEVTAGYTYGVTTKTDTHTVKVLNDKVLNNLVISGVANVDEGTSENYTARAYYSNGSNEDVTNQCEWDVDNYGSISGSGLFTADEVDTDQTVTITAEYTFGGVTKSDDYDVTVRDTKTLVSIEISGPETVPENTSTTLMVTAYFSEGASANVTSECTWSVDGPGTIDDITALFTAGEVSSDQAVTITAEYTFDGVTKFDDIEVTVINYIPPPDSPTGVAAETGPVYGQVILNWNSTDRATGYRIFYAENSSSPPYNPVDNGIPVSGSDVGDVTQVAVNQLEAGKTYYFAVTAYNSSGESDYSTRVAAKASASTYGIEFVHIPAGTFMMGSPRKRG